jgi:hypothetical protein
MSVSNPTTADRLRWICNTSAEDGKAEIKRLQANKDLPPAELRALLVAAHDYENTHQKRTSLVAAIAAAVNRIDKDAIKSGTRVSLLKLETSNLNLEGGTTQVVPPSWDRARQILSGITLALRISLAGQVMLGAELQQLKRELGFTHGGSRKAGANDKTWEQHVKDELGLSDRTADRMIASWEAARAKLKKLGGQPALLAILGTPPSALTAIQRQTLEAAVAKTTDGETQKSLLEELKLVKFHDTSGIGGDTSAHRKPLTDEENVGQLAFIFFETVAEPLQRLCTQPDRTAYYIAMAEQHPAELSNLEQLLESTLHDVRAAKARRLQPKP